MGAKHDYVVSSGNVFADLGIPRPEEALAKAALAHKISRIIRALHKRLSRGADLVLSVYHFPSTIPYRSLSIGSPIPELNR